MPRMSDATKVPEATFLNFLSGLSAQALMQFGDIPSPITGTREINEAYARYTVQLLEVLEAKTKGNRTPQENEYLMTMLNNFHAKLAKLG
jgi:Domain of unknown function (DUF1844)